MQFRLLALKLANFKAYYSEHEWKLPQGAGLFYITGQNKFNRRLGTNGIGKSTLTDAINWVLYGKTSRGLRATDVVTWGKNSCEVTASFQIGDERHDITRSQHPNKILINGNPANQDEVSKLIRINQEAMNNAMLLPQFGSSFLDLSPAGKLAMFAQVMDLDYWLERSNRAHETSDNIEESIHQVENKIAQCKGKIIALRDGISDLKQKSADFKTSIDQEINAFKAKLVKLKNLVKNCQVTLEVEEVKLKRIRVKRDQAFSDADNANKALNDYRPKIATLEATLAANGRRIKELTSELTDINDLKGKICPTCRQSVGKDHSRKHEQLVLEKQRGLKVEAAKWEKDLLKQRTEMKRAADDYSNLHLAYTRANSAHIDRADDISQLRNSIIGLNRDIDMLGSHLAETRSRDNPFKSLIADNIQERKVLKQTIAKRRVKLDELKVLHEATAYWIKGFKRVRLFVVEEALSALEIEVNNLLISLGLIDWKVTFDIERENKSGGVTKGFTVLIHSPKYSKPVKFESFSGGEVQRLRLAGDLGLSNLIMEQAGFENMVEIIDEPSEHLSAEGIEDLIETISQRAHDTGKQVWLVEHHSLASNLFDGTLRISMDKKGRASLNYE